MIRRCGICRHAGGVGSAGGVVSTGAAGMVGFADPGTPGGMVAGGYITFKISLSC